MQMTIGQIERRTAELEKLADEVAELLKRQAHSQSVQPELSIKGFQWYRGARELIVQNDLPGRDEFDVCFGVIGGTSDLSYSIGGIGPFPIIVSGVRIDYEGVSGKFQKARSIVLAAQEEFRSRLLSLRSILSFAVSADEFDTAQGLLDSSKEDSIIRASGVVARVALERHLFSVADSRSTPNQVNPPLKQKPEAQDVLDALAEAAVITEIQKTELESLFAIGDNCAHPKEIVEQEDVERLIRRGRELAVTIL